MTTITRKVHIDAPRDRVWEILADFGGVQAYSPGVPKSYSTSGVNGGVGATRHCDLAINGAAIEERIIEWRDGESYVVDIYDGKKAPPFKTARAYLEVKDEIDGATVTGTLEYRLKYGPVGVLMDRMMVEPQFAKAWDGFFAGLKHYAETGEPVDRSTPLEREAVTVVEP